MGGNGDTKELELFIAYGEEQLQLFREIIKRANMQPEEDRAAFINGAIHGIESSLSILFGNGEWRGTSQRHLSSRAMGKDPEVINIPRYPDPKDTPPLPDFPKDIRLSNGIFAKQGAIREIYRTLTKSHLERKTLEEIVAKYHPRTEPATINQYVMAYTRYMIKEGHMKRLPVMYATTLGEESAKEEES